MGKKEITKNALVFFFGTLSSRVLGFVRDILIAQFFGAGSFTDAFFVAFRIPNLFRRLIGEGALSAAFIPVFAEYEARGKSLKEVVNEAFFSLFVVLCLLLLFGEIFTKELVTLISPGFLKEPEILRLTAELTRITFFYIFFMGLAILIGAALNYKRDFFYTSSSPVLLNLSFIAAMLIFRKAFRPEIFCLAWAVFAGGILQLLFHLWGAAKLGVLPRPTFKLFSEPVRKAVKLMLPATLGFAVHQINVFVDTVIASFLEWGSISFLYYANRLFQLPLALFGIGIGSVLLPEASEKIAKGERQKALESTRYSVSLSLFVTLPAAMGLAVFSREIVDLLFRRGAFGIEAVEKTAAALFMYALGLPFISVNKITTSLFYAHQDMKTPVKISIVALLANIVFNLIFVFPLKHAGLALATSVSALLQCFLLFSELKKKGYGAREILPEKGRRLFFLNFILFLFMLFLKKTLSYPFSGPLGERAAYIGAYIFLSVFSLFLLAKIMGFQETKLIEESLKAKLRR